jgi:hypothetical protein
LLEESQRRNDSSFNSTSRTLHSAIRENTFARRNCRPEDRLIQTGYVDSGARSGKATPASGSNSVPLK